MISKSTQLISICSTVNKDLQGIHQKTTTDEGQVKDSLVTKAHTKLG